MKPKKTEEPHKRAKSERSEHTRGALPPVRSALVEVGRPTRGRCSSKGGLDPRWTQTGLGGRESPLPLHAKINTSRRQHTCTPIYTSLAISSSNASHDEHSYSPVMLCIEQCNGVSSLFSSPFAPLMRSPSSTSTRRCSATLWFQALTCLHLRLALSDALDYTSRAVDRGRIA